MTVSITVSPTEGFFQAEKTMVRAWEGTLSDGRPVVALVAGVRVGTLEGDQVKTPEGETIPGLTPIPPPQPEWSEQLTIAMGRLWQIAGQLLDEEATGLVLIAEQLIRCGEGPGRLEAAQKFVVDAYAMRNEP